MRSEFGGKTMNHDAIKRRAYELYESRGREDGRDLDDWLQAEHEVGSDDSEVRRSAPRNSTSSAADGRHAQERRSR
jgi:hypothetical protein